MELFISDISSLCFSDADIVSREDPDMCERVRAAVMAELGQAKPMPGRKKLRTFLLAAALAALLTTAAFAVSGFIMNMKKTDGEISGRWTYLDDEGNIAFDQEMNFPHAGMLFTFEGPAERPNQPEFRAFWLPEGNISGRTDEEGWTGFLCDNGDGEGSMPFLIEAWGVNTGNCKYVLNGEVSVLGEEEKNGWEIIKLSCDYKDTPIKWEGNRANYVLLFNPKMGYLVRVGGTAEMEIIEKIAENLEVRESDRPPFESGMSESIGCLDIGRG